jgi:hypothetical protein
MNEYPNLKIEIGGHTDGKGSDDYNNRLSRDRAESVVNYLIEMELINPAFLQRVWQKHSLSLRMIPRREDRKTDVLSSKSFRKLV